MNNRPVLLIPESANHELKKYLKFRTLSNWADNIKPRRVYGHPLIESPRPVPFPIPFVVKNGSKIFR